MREKKYRDSLAYVVKGFKAYKPSRDALVFLVCVMISTTFWLLRALDKPMEVTLKFPVFAKDVPAGQKVFDILTPYIEVKVKDQGFNILSYKFSRKRYGIPLSCSLSRAELRNSRGLVSMLSNTTESLVKRQLYASTQIVSISPDTLQLDLSAEQKKRVPVKYRGEIEYAAQRVGEKPIFSPDSVEISGFKRIIDTIDAVYVKKQSFKPLQDTLRRNVSLLTQSGVYYSHTRVAMTIPVEYFTENVVQVKVEGLNVPDSLKFTSIPGLVEIRFLAPLSASGDASHFRVVADCSELKKNPRAHITLRLVKSPKSAFNMVLVPTEVAYVLEKVDVDRFGSVETSPVLSPR